MSYYVTSGEMDLSFDDVLINPAFSMVRSRSNVSLANEFLGQKIGLPIINANMDTIASIEMANAMNEQGAMAALHRFQSIEENVQQLHTMMLSSASNRPTFVSVGTGTNELDRAEALMLAGAERFIIDVAHGAAIHVVEQYDALRALGGSNILIVVGNFANAKSIEDFHYHSKSKQKIDAAKTGVGGGSMCTTRIVTGCGRSTLSSVLDCSRIDIPLIADGGFRTSGDIAKALAAGASAVMLGGMLAGTDETPGETIRQVRMSNGQIVSNYGTSTWENGSDSELLADVKALRAFHAPSGQGAIPTEVLRVKSYRGSASKESYESQGKSSDHRTAEGEATTVAYKGPVSEVMQQIRAGLLSAFSYVGASNLAEFQERAELIQVSNSTKVENSAHGVRK